MNIRYIWGALFLCQMLIDLPANAYFMPQDLGTGTTMKNIPVTVKLVGIDIKDGKICAIQDAKPTSEHIQEYQSIFKDSADVKYTEIQGHLNLRQYQNNFSECRQLRRLFYYNNGEIFADYKNASKWWPLNNYKPEVVLCAYLKSLNIIDSRRLNMFPQQFSDGDVYVGPYTNFGLSNYEYYKIIALEGQNHDMLTRTTLQVNESFATQLYDYEGEAKEQRFFVKGQLKKDKKGNNVITVTEIDFFDKKGIYINTLQSK